jgi:nucleotide-binding universal stress UspA family protein
MCSALEDKERAMAFRKILCPIDFSDHSRRALTAALELGGPEAEITLLHVVEYPFMLAFPEVSIDLGFLAQVQASSEKTMVEWLALARQRGNKVSSACVVGVPWDEIVTRCNQEHHDVIVIGTHGRTGIKRALLGSVAERVVRHAPVPVLVVRS